MIIISEKNETIDKALYRATGSTLLIDETVKLNPNLPFEDVFLPYGTRILIPDNDVEKKLYYKLW